EKMVGSAVVVTVTVAGPVCVRLTMPRNTSVTRVLAVIVCPVLRLHALRDWTGTWQVPIVWPLTRRMPPTHAPNPLPSGKSTLIRAAVPLTTAVGVNWTVYAVRAPAAGDGDRSSDGAWACAEAAKADSMTSVTARSVGRRSTGPTLTAPVSSF